MYMVWHCYEFVERNFGKPILDFMLGCVNQLTRFITDHSSIVDVTKKRDPVLRAYGDEVCVGLGVI
jgi:hypothetical protein